MDTTAGGTPAPPSRPFRLAQRIIIAAFKILIPDVATRLEGISEIADIIVGDREPQTISRLLEDNARQLSRRLEGLEAAEFSGLPEAEKNLAIVAIVEAIDKLSLTKSDIIAKRMDRNDLYRSAIPLAEKAWESFGLGGSAISYGERYLQESTAFISSFVQRLPDFSDELLVANYDLTYKIHDLLQLAISNVVLPRYREGSPDEFAAFESEYRTSVISDNDTMDLFGLGVPEELRQQRIEVAYITLKAFTIGDPTAVPDQMDTMNSSGPALRVDEAFAEVLKAGLETDDRSSEAVQRTRGARILLTGTAGSGKTTIGQWLCIKSAQHSFRDDLKPWNACTPFRIALRDVFRGNDISELRVEDLIQPSSLRRNLPGNWMETRLRQECLVIFDGLDELSSAQKRAFGKWAARLGEDYPHVNIVITSRPEGVDSEWFSGRHFVQLGLQPMNSLDIRRCIDAWYRALIGISVRGRQPYRKHQARLLSDLENQEALRELAATPLLCAMLCAFYAYNHSASAPETRGELYREVIATLVHEREHERDPKRSATALLRQKQKMVLLQGLARYMQDTSTSTIVAQRLPGSSPTNEWPSRDEKKTAKEVIESRLPRMSLLDITADKALETLLNRSIVFRSVGYKQAHFAHRTIQEYLAACDYVDDGDVDALLAHVHESPWWRVMAFAASRFSMRDASALTSGILEISIRTAPRVRRSLILLAAECYMAAGGLQQDVASSLREAIEEIFPPENFEEAEMVARGGPQMLPRLDGRLNYPDAVIAACVRAASLIGGTQAVSVIATYAKRSASPMVVDEIVNSWQRFDTHSYASDVLKYTPLAGSWISVRTTQTFSAVSLLSNLTKIRIESYEQSYDFRQWGNLDRLEELDFGANWNLRSLESISNLTRLRRINLTGAKSLQDISELAGVQSLHELYLGGCLSLKDISSIGALKNLRVLVLDGCRGVEDFSVLSQFPNLVMLSLNDCRCRSLRFCADMPRLRRLHAVTIDGIAYAREIASCAELYRLELKTDMYDADRLRLPEGNALRTLCVKGAIRSNDLSSLASHTKLSEITVSGCTDLADLSILRGLPLLRSLSFVDCPELVDVDGLSDSSSLEAVDLSGSSIHDVDYLHNKTGLQRVSLNRCRRLKDISGLLSLPSLKYVSLLGVARDVKPSPERLAEAFGPNRQVFVVHEPLVETEQQYMSDEHDDSQLYRPDMEYVSWPFDGYSG
jgi:hypothetical protein